MPNTCRRVSMIHFSSCFAFFLLCSLHAFLSLHCSGPHLHFPPPTCWRKRGSSFHSFLSIGRKSKVPVTACLLIPKYGRATRMNSFIGEKGGALRDKFLKEFRSFWNQLISGNHSPGNWSSLLHKIIHPNNSFKKEGVDGWAFFSCFW